MLGAGQIGEIDLALAAIARQNRHHAPHRDAQAMTRQRLGAELLGDDGADPVDQIGQVIAEIELGTGALPRGRRGLDYCIYNRCIIIYSVAVAMKI